MQGCFTYRHDEVLQCLPSGISEFLAQTNSICIYADLPATESPQGTIPASLLVTPYRPDIVIYNEASNSVALLIISAEINADHSAQVCCIVCI